MKIDCPECGGGVGVLSIREGRAKCPSCGKEFDTGEHIARLSSRRTSTAPSRDSARPAALDKTPQDKAPHDKTTLKQLAAEEADSEGTPERDSARTSPRAPPPRDSSRRAGVIDELGRIGPYEEIREVARGGMGVVYKARNRHLKKLVAIKVLKRDTDDSEEVRRFRREAEAAARLQHSNIVPIHAVGEVLGRPYFVMDFIEGRVLSDFIRSGELSPRSALDIAQQVAGAVHYAHSQGVIHRDLKPHNIIIDRLGRPQVMDFGLAKQLDEDQSLTQAGTTMGTPAYMPPEQAEGDISEVDERSDVYAIGAVLYEMLTGTPPFAGTSTMNILMKVLEEEPTTPRAVNPRIHRDIETICLKAMSKEKSRRYTTPAELAEDIRRFHAGEAISAAPSTSLYKMKRWASKNKAAVAAIVVLVVAFGTVTGWGLGRADRERRSELAAEHRRRRLTLERAENALAEAKAIRHRRHPGWRDRARELFDAAKMEAEYVLRNSPRDPDAASVADAARRMKQELRVDELLGHARDFLEKDQYVAAETFFKIVLEDYDPANAEARQGLKLARGVGELRLATKPAGVEAILLPYSEQGRDEPGRRKIALGRTPLERRGVPTGLYRLLLADARGGRHEIPVEMTRSQELDLGEIQLPEVGPAGDGMVFVPEGLVELPGGRRTWIDAFLIDRYESGARLGEVPREGMSWVEAAAACRERGRRLCSLSEWRRACSAGPDSTGSLPFPYGATFDPTACWTGQRRGPWPAGGRAGCVSGFGVYDMSGNVAEWVGRDEVHATTYGGDWSVGRGGALDEGALLGCGSDFYRSPHERAPRAGFRCCRGATGEKAGGE